MSPTVITVTSTVVRVEQGSVKRRVAAERAHQGDPKTALTDLCGGLARAWPIRAVMVIEPPLVQVRRVSHLPPVSDRELAAIVAQQPERYFRPTDGALTTGAIWLTAPTPCALLAAARESDLDAMVLAAHRAGVSIDRIVPAGCEPARINLLPEPERARRRRRDVRTIAALAVTLLALWAAALGAKAYRLQREVAGLERRLAEIDTAAESVRQARAQVEQVETAIAVADSLRGARAGLVSLLSAVVERLPRDAHLLAVQVTPDSLALTGVAASPALVVKRLSEAGPFGRVRLEPPRGRGPTSSGGAPFDLVAIRAVRP